MTAVASGADSAETLTGPDSVRSGAETSLTGRRPARQMVLGPLAAVAILVAAPFFVDSFTLVLLMQVLSLGLLALSLDVLVGHAGLASLGQAGYYALGAYTAGLVSIHVTPNVFVAALAALSTAALGALLTGILTARSHGIFLLMLTLAFGQLVHSGALGWDSVTGGSNGLAGIPTPSLLHDEDGTLGHDAFVYWWMVLVVIATYLVVRRVMQSPFGAMLRGTMVNEPRMRSLGHHTAGYRVAVFGMSGAVAGLAGALSVWAHGFVSPTDASFNLSVLALVMVIVGGTGSLRGAFAGAAVVVLVQNQLAAYLPGKGLLMLGVAFIAFVYLAPEGLAGLWSRAGHQGRRLLGLARRRMHAPASGGGSR